MRSSDSASRPGRFSGRYWRRLARALLFVAVVAGLVVPAALGAVPMLVLLYTPCNESGATPDDYGYTWEDVAFPSASGDSIRAYFIPGTNGATVIIPPPLGSGRGNRLNEADVLARHGYAVLTFESRRCAGMGPLSLGTKEADDIGDALAYLLTRDGVVPDRIAVMGFSAAGAAAIMAAARYPGLQAVIAQGGYGDFAEGALHLDQTSAFLLDAITKRSLALVYRMVTGVSIHSLSPLDVIATIAPRPILLIYGSEEVSLAGGIDQRDAAGDHATLWVVEGAGHGNYLQVAPAAFEMRVIGFLDRELLGREASAHDGTVAR